MPKIIFATDAKKEFTELSVKLKDSYGYDVCILQTEAEIIERISNEVVDVLIIDLEMKSTDGILLCSEIAALKNGSLPFIIIASERTEDYIQTAAFDSGADQFVLKPLKPTLIAIRMKALMRRRTNVSPIINGVEKKLVIDVEKHLVYVDSKEIVLARKEFNLLYLLYSNSGKIFSRTEIAKHIWGDASMGERGRRTIDVHLSNLRNKIGVEYFRTVSGIGYIFNFEKNKT